MWLCLSEPMKICHVIIFTCHPQVRSTIIKFFHSVADSPKASYSVNFFEFLVRFGSDRSETEWGGVLGSLERIFKPSQRFLLHPHDGRTVFLNSIPALCLPGYPSSHSSISSTSFRETFWWSFKSIRNLITFELPRN